MSQPNSNYPAYPPATAYDATYGGSPVVQPIRPSTLGMWGMFLGVFATLLGGGSGWIMGASGAPGEMSTMPGFGYGLIFAATMGWGGLIVSILALAMNRGRKYAAVGLGCAVLGPVVTVAAMMLSIWLTS